jgi:putative ABC transport system permease protein
MVVGYELDSENIEPWDVIKGDVDDLQKKNSMIIDESLLDFFPGYKIGDSLTFGKNDYEIIGICKNARWMAQPYIWMSLENARKLYTFAGNWSNTIGLKLKHDYEIDDLKEDVEIYGEYEVLTTEELRENTHSFIVNEGGMGGSIFIIVAMGFFVGMIIITVSMYQSVQEKIPEFGTIKAIGADKWFISKMLFGQVFIYVSIGFLIAVSLTIFIGITNIFNSIIPVILDIPITFILYGITLLISFLCSYISIRKVHKIDPAIVFAG